MTDIQFSANSRLLVFAADDASYGYLNTMQHKVEQVYYDHDKNYSCSAVSISQSDTFIAAGAADGTLVVRSLKEHQVTIKDKQIKAPIT